MSGVGLSTLCFFLDYIILLFNSLYSYAYIQEVCLRARRACTCIVCGRSQAIYRTRERGAGKKRLNGISKKPCVQYFSVAVMSGAGCTFTWQCIHCSGTLLLPAGTNLPFCPFCKASGQPPDAPPVDGDNGQSQIVYSADNHRENPRAQLKHDSEEGFVHLSKETTESPFVTDPAPPRRATTQSVSSHL